MANQTAERGLTYRGTPTYQTWPSQADKNWMGAALSRNSDGQLGILTASEPFAGLCRETLDNSAGSAGQSGRDTEVYTEGEFKLAVSGAVAGDEDKAVFMGADNQTFSYNPKAAQYVGQVRQVDSSGQVWASIKTFAKSWETWTSLADDGSIDLPTGEEAIVTVIGGGEGGVFHVTTAGAVTKLSGTTNAVASDSDTDLCVFDNGTEARVRNRLGSTKTVKIAYQAV